MLGRLQQDLTTHTAETLHKSYIFPVLEYCDSAWEYCNKGDVDKLECRQGRVVRIVVKFESREKVLSILKWDTLESRKKNHVLKLVMKCINSNVPQFLCDYFSLIETLL